MVSVDTLRLRFTPESWYPMTDADITINPCSVSMQDAMNGNSNNSSVVFWKDKKPIYGKGAFHNSKDGKYIADIKGQNLYMQFSIPRVHSDDNTNYHPVDRQQAKKAMQTVCEYFDGKGIKADYQNAELSRVDLFRNIKTDNNISDYNNILKNCFSMKYHKPKKRADYKDGFLSASTTTQLCMYDKVRAVWDRYKVRLKDKNILRSEYRTMKGKTTREHFGYTSAKGLIDNWDGLTDIYTDSLKSRLFKSEVTKSNIEAQASLVKAIRNTIILGDSLKDFFLFQDIDDDIDTFGGMTGFRSVLLDIGKELGDAPLRRIYRFLRFIQYGIDSRADKQTSKVYDLYSELKYKLLKAG